MQIANQKELLRGLKRLRKYLKHLLQKMNVRVGILWGNDKVVKLTRSMESLESD